MQITKKIYPIISSLLFLSAISLIILFISTKNSDAEFFSAYKNTDNSSKSITFFIDCNGNDSNPGTKTKPFATLEAARNAIRNLKKQNKLNSNTVTVYIRGGTYYRTKSFNLESIDSGTDNHSITYKPYDNEKVIISGGICLDKNKFTKVTDNNILNKIIDENARNYIFQYDLNSDNIYYGNITQNIKEAPELFYNDNPLLMARWPKSNSNDDNYKDVNNNSYTGTIISNKNSQYTFQFSDTNNTDDTFKNRPLLWKNASDAWLLGYWGNDWADFTVKLDSIDSKNKNITFGQNVSYGVKKNQRYFAFNLLEEISNPGEWYLDRKKGFIYISLPPSMNNNDIYISQLADPFISMKTTSHLTIEGITFQYGRNTAITINNGQNNTVAGCTIRNISKNAITIDGGTLNGVQSCNIYNTGTGGININGGDRNKLVAAHNYADNNDIYNYSRIKRTYTAAVSLNGVGNKASHNHIHNAPHTGILFWGNDHTIEYNEIDSVATETDDVGAIYTGRDWTFRGNIIRYNYIHNIENPIGNCGKSGVYLDDCMSSADVIGNIFYKVNRALMIGGGKANKLSNNMIIDCKDSIYFDDRGLTCKLDSLYNNIKKVPFQNQTWKEHYKERYPDLYNILDNSLPGNPIDNIVTKNALYMTSKPSISESVIKNGTVNENIFFEPEASFVNNDTLNFEILSNSSINIPDFESIPFDKIGMYQDNYR